MFPLNPARVYQAGTLKGDNLDRLPLAAHTPRKQSRKCERRLHSHTRVKLRLWPFGRQHSGCRRKKIPATFSP